MKSRAFHRIAGTVVAALLAGAWGPGPGVGSGEAGGEGESSPWDLLRPLVGRWEGTGTGESGKGKVERSYEFVLNDRFLEVRNRVVYEPKVPGAAGEVHEDLGMVSYDLGRKKFVLRQFHVEGFVNQYVLDEVEEEGEVLRFTSEAIENLAPGGRARETLEWMDEDALVERFELAMPGGEFQLYSTIRLERAE